MLLVRRISNVLGFVGGLTQVAAICVLTASAGIFAVPAVAQEGVTCGMVETANGPQFWGPCHNQTNRPQTQPDVWGAIALEAVKESKFSEGERPAGLVCLSSSRGSVRKHIKV
jgi:hypothetical protein